MSNECTPIGAIGKIVDRSTPSLVTGSDGYITTQIVFASTRRPRSFKNFAGATAMFPGAVASVAFVGTLVSADLATVNFAMPASGTALITPGDPVSFQVNVVDDVAGHAIILFEDAITIVASLF